MGFKKPASAQQANYSCPKCSEKFVEGKDIYMQKGEDGKWFSCHNLECFKSQGGTVEEKKSFSSSKHPIGNAVNVYKLSEEILDQFLKKRKDKTLSISEQAVFIESIFRTLSGNFKS